MRHSLRLGRWLARLATAFAVVIAGQAGLASADDSGGAPQGYSTPPVAQYVGDSGSASYDPSAGQSCGCAPGDNCCCDPFYNPTPSLLLGGLIDESTLIGSLLHRSDHDYDRLISPMTNPVLFEDPRTLTEVRTIFVNHVLPPLVPNAGNQLRVVAAQIRLALTDNTSLIATKDGYIFSDFPLVDDGFADVMLGLKHNVYKNCECQRILSAGLTYEAPFGSRRALQGYGSGRFNLFLTGTTAVGDYGQAIAQTGFRMPVDNADGNQLWYASTHLNRRVLFNNLYAFTEFNMYHFMSSGRAFPLPVNGGDFFDLGSTGIAGKTMVTGAIGVKLKPSAFREYGVAWEAPLTKERGVLDNRLTADAILRY